MCLYRYGAEEYKDMALNILKLYLVNDREE